MAPVCDHYYAYVALHTRLCRECGCSPSNEKNDCQLTGEMTEAAETKRLQQNCVGSPSKDTDNLAIMAAATRSA